VRDDSTLVVTLKEPFAIFTKLLAMPVTSIVPAELPANFDQRPIGTGPWKFVEWKHDDYLLFARNEAYWGGPPKADSLRARILAEPSTAVAEFESGNTDVVLIPASETIAWEEDAERKPLMQSTAALVMTYVAINTTRGPLKDKRVRQAMNYAINAPQIIDILLSGGGRRAAGVIPPSLEGADTTRQPYPFDSLKARALMKEAGYAQGITVDLWVGSNPLYIRIAETMQAYLKMANITVKIVQRESAAAREAARNGQADLFLKDWYADYPDAENFLYPLLHSNSHAVGGNVSFFKHAEFDRIVSEARREQDDAKRIALYTRADSLAFEEAPMIFMHFAKTTLGVQPWLKGFEVPAIPNGQRMLTVTIDTTGSSE
jgi:ABC-type transport system substrate-binding protein